ncbi:hypothetical protein Acr_12g0002720 [Actinidia rufa]|uniref:Uncharacterized protein n=1 Tax=Actinidia rufa TaxID=165716 RepID=A0A7J0FGC1_9ERIC|nr:hypothetical protein Acr_12g0002720 [Actinidia rufa]
MKNMEEDELEDNWVYQIMHWTQDESSWVVDQVGGDVPGEDILEQSLNEEACVEASERDYSGRTNERVLEKRPQEKVKEEAKEEVKEEISAEGKIQSTTAMMAVDESDVLLAALAYEESDWIPDSGNAYHWCRDREVFSTHVAYERSLKVTGVRYVSLRCKIRSDEALKLVEEHSEFPKKIGDATGERRLMAISIGGEMSRQEELLSDMGPVVLVRIMDEESNCCTETRKASAGIPGGFVHTREERWNYDNLQSNVLCSAPRWGGVGHLSKKVQALRFGSAFTSVEVELPVEEGDVSRDRREEKRRKKEEREAVDSFCQQGLQPKSQMEAPSSSIVKNGGMYELSHELIFYSLWLINSEGCLRRREAEQKCNP